MDWKDNQGDQTVLKANNQVAAASKCQRVGKEETSPQILIVDVSSVHGHFVAQAI